MSIRLNSSKLGTQDYWNNFYEKELENFNQNDEDLGECWFDDSNAEDKMIQYITSYISESKKSGISFLDLGTGNGHLLFQLHEDLKEEEVAGEFQYFGIDYSPNSVKFAKDIAVKKYPDQTFTFDQVDLLNENYKGEYDILLDKGTLDAIALNQEPISNNKIGMEVYPSKIETLMKKDSVCLITSCNFTKEELINIIQTNSNLKYYDEINYPSFQFGGIQGSTVVSLIFKL